MAHKLLRLTERLYNTPHLVTQESLDNILAFLNNRNNEKATLSTVKLDSYDDMEGGSDCCYNPDTGVGVIEIEGPLTDKKIDFNPMCGGEEACSYEGILDQVNMLVEMGANTIVMQIDSGGGEAYGCFETANEVRAICDENKIDLIAYVDGIACSAAYAWACVADEIILNPYAEVGSVGVVVGLMNNAKQLEQNGIQRTFVFAGDSKVPFSPDGEFRKEFIADIQGKVDNLYQAFVSHVADHTSMSKEAIINTQAKTYMADEAVNMGMADKVMSRIDFANHLADLTDNKRNPSMSLRKLLGLPEKTAQAELSQTELEAQVEAKFNTVEAEKATAVAELAALKLTAELAEQAAKEQLAALQAQVAEQAQAMAQAKTEARKASLVAIMGTAKAEATFASLESLDDAAYATVLGVLTAQEKLISESPVFKELGVTGNDSEDKKDNRVAEIIKADVAKAAK